MTEAPCRVHCDGLTLRLRVQSSPVQQPFVRSADLPSMYGRRCRRAMAFRVDRTILLATGTRDDDAMNVMGTGAGVGNGRVYVRDPAANGEPTDRRNGSQSLNGRMWSRPRTDGDNCRAVCRCVCPSHR